MSSYIFSRTKNSMRFLKQYIDPHNWTWSHVIIIGTFAFLFTLISILYSLLIQEQKFNNELREDVNANNTRIQSIDGKLDKILIQLRANEQ